MNFKTCIVIAIAFCFITMISCDSWPDIIYKNCISGAVIMKDKPEYQHGAMVVSFSNSCDNSFGFLTVFNSDEIFWNYLSVGDSLFKEAESMVIKVKKSNETRTFELADW